MTDQDFQIEIETRIAQAEKGFSEIRSMQKQDYIEIGLLVLLCLAGIIWGAFL